VIRCIVSNLSRRLKLKIFVLNLHRCATKSTDLFLKKAGFTTCHWPSVVDGVNYESLVEGYEDQPSRIVEILRPVFEKFDAFSDVPIPAIYKELDRVYPNSKFIAIYRNPFDWVRSVKAHVNKRPLHPFERAQYWQYLLEQPKYIHDVSLNRLLEMYMRHHSELLSYFNGRSQDFILVDLSAPYCGEIVSSFLGTVPEQFPRVVEKGIK
jgi:hypothetical protein